MITRPRLHDITASFNTHGRIVLKIPHDYSLTAVSSEHQLHSWCPWERQSGYTNSRLLWGREIHFLGQDFSYGTPHCGVCPNYYGIIWQMLPHAHVSAPQTQKHVHDVSAEYCKCCTNGLATKIKLWMHSFIFVSFNRVQLTEKAEWNQCFAVSFLRTSWHSVGRIND